MANDNVSALLALKGGAGSGGGSDFFEVLIDKASSTTTADKTYYEIQQAFLAGKLVVFNYADDDAGWASMAFAKYELPGFTAYFYEGNSGFSVTIAADDSVSVTPYSSVPTTVTVSGTTPTITAADNTIYECGEVTSLTVSSFPASGEFLIVFASGSTPTTLSLPNELDARMPSGFTVEADTHYEISVRNGWPMVGSCPIPAQA